MASRSLTAIIRTNPLRIVSSSVRAMSGLGDGAGKMIHTSAPQNKLPVSSNSDAPTNVFDELIASIKEKRTQVEKSAAEAAAAEQAAAEQAAAEQAAAEQAAAEAAAAEAAEKAAAEAAEKAAAEAAEKAAAEAAEK